MILLAEDYVTLGEDPAEFLVFEIAATGMRRRPSQARTRSDLPITAFGLPRVSGLALADPRRRRLRDVQVIGASTPAKVAKLTPRPAVRYPAKPSSLAMWRGIVAELLGAAPMPTPMTRCPAEPLHL